MKILIYILFFITSAFSLTKVTLDLLWKHQFEFAGFYIAKEKGFYKEVGLDVEFREFNNNDIVKDVLEQKATFGIGYTNVIYDIMQHKDLILLFPILNSSAHVLIAQKNIKTIKDFKNKKIMINKNAIKSASFLSMFRANNISLNDMNIIKHSFNINDFIDKKVDIMSAYLSNEPYFLNKQNIKYNIFDPKNYGFDFYDDIVFTSKSFYKNNYDIVKNFKKASIKGWIYAYNHLDEAIDIIYQKYNTFKKSKDALRYEALTLKKLIDFKNFGKINKEKILRTIYLYNLIKPTKFKEHCINKNLFQDISFTKEEKKYLKTHKIIKMCNNPNWEPIEFAKDGNMKQMSGIVIDVLKILEKDLNVKFVNVPTKSWSESQQFLKEKKCDILPAAIKTKKRLKYANFTKPYLSYKLLIITKNDIIVNKLDDIVNKPMSRKEGSGLITKLKSLYPNIKIIETKDYLESLRKVSNGEAFFTIATLPVAGYYISKFAINNLHIAGYTDMIYNLSIAVRKDNKILRDILDKALSKIDKKEIEKINNKWSNIEIKEGLNYQDIRNIVIVIFIIIFAILYKQYLTSKHNQKLKKLVDEKTKELQQINQELEIKIQKALEENKKQQHILYQQSKMASLGEMLENIAHQWRQPLSAISTAASGILLSKELNCSNDKQELEALEQIVSSTKYLSDTIDDFRNFFRPDKEKTKFNIKNTYLRTKKLIHSKYKNYEIQLIENLIDYEIVSYENEIIQVLLNILNNARDALKDKEKRLVFINIEIKDKLIISIQDSGGGIKEDIIDKIFEPYFTTKHKSQGTGIGLYMSREIITKHIGGELVVENVSFKYNNYNLKGAKFSIKIPI